MEKNVEKNIIAKDQNSLPPCCQPVNKPEGRKGFFWGVIYGILPHTFCLLFIVLSVIGATAGAAFFEKFLVIRWFFPALIALSFLFATISAMIYLYRNKKASFQGIRNSWKYLSMLYGTTIAISLLFIYVVFPYAVSSAYNNASNNPESARQEPGSAQMTIAVDIPCSGHAPLIIAELKKLESVQDVNYQSPNIFKIAYDKTKNTKQDILSLEIFKTYKATEKNQ